MMWHRVYCSGSLSVLAFAVVAGIIVFSSVESTRPFSLAGGTAIAAPGARIQVPQPVEQGLTAETRAKLAQAATDPAVDKWQREVMRELADRTDPRKPDLREEMAGFQYPSPGEYPDGYWLETLPRPETRSGHTAIYDPIHRQIVVFGGYDASSYHSDTWAKVFPDSAWHRLQTFGDLPPQRANHTAIFDPIGKRMIVFGGWNADSTLKDAWALSLGGYTYNWSRLPDAPMASGRYGHTATYDPIRHRMWVFGGDDGLFRNDTWALDLGPTCEWSLITPSGTPPGARRGHTAIYDSFRGRMVVFGGNSGVRLNDTWELSLADPVSWMQLAPTGTPPSGRDLHTAVYDSLRERMIVFAGKDAHSRVNDTWALSLGDSLVWTEIVFSGELPRERAEHVAIYDPVLMQMMVFGGGADDLLTHFDDTWVLPLAGDPEWTELGGRPSVRYGPMGIYDPVGDHVIVFGGEINLGGAPLTTSYNDAWTLSVSERPPKWTKLTPSGSPPGERCEGSAIYDPRGQRMVVFGGIQSYHQTYNDTWVLSLTGDPAWSQLSTSGGSPPVRSGHTAICDYDPALDQYRMVVFGGYGGSGPLNDVWELSLGASPTWTQLSPSGGPPNPRYCHSAIYVPGRRQMIVFGGSPDGTSHYRDVWMLSLQDSLQWSDPSPSGAPPAARHGHVAIYDPFEDRMVVQGGYPAPSSPDDTWFLWLSGTPRWVERASPDWETPPLWRGVHAGVFVPTPLSGRLVMFGGSQGVSTMLNDTWTLSFYSPSDVPPDAPDVSAPLTLRPPQPNPFSATTFVQFALPSGGPVRLDLLDITGRLVRTLEDRLLSPGTHGATWDGTDGDGRLLPAGIYFLRLESSEGTFQQKVVRIQ